MEFSIISPCFLITLTCVSDPVYTLFKNVLDAVPHYFVKMFYLQVPYIFYGAAIPVAPTTKGDLYSFDQEKVPYLSSHLPTIHMKNLPHKKSCLPNCFTIFCKLIEEIYHGVNSYRLVKRMTFFILIFLVRFPPLKNILIFSHSLLMKTSVGKSSKFPIPSSSPSTIITFSEGLSSSSMKTWFSLKIKQERNKLYSFPYFISISYTYLLF